jgi:uncharacterized membrane protein
MKIKAAILLLLFGAMNLWMTSCKHSPIAIDDDMMPIDTMPDDTMTIDTSGNGVPCDPNVIYFETDILPLLQSNCAFSGCHDAASAEDGVVLISYETVMATGDVEPFDLSDSELYEVLVEGDIDKRMPPSPTPALNQDKIQLIAQWILQGAENLACDPDLEPCETDNVSFASFVKPILDLYCVGCHSGNPPSGGIDLSNYQGVKAVADNGSLIGAINWTAGFSKMPKNGDQLPDCEIDKIKSWVDAGALDN